MSALLPDTCLVLALLVAVGFAQSTLASEKGFDRLLNCRATDTTLEQCDKRAYQALVLTSMGPSLLVAAIVLVAMPVYLICKYAADRCGGRYRSNNYCISREGDAVFYGVRDVWRPRLVLLVATIVLLGSTIAGAIEGSRVLSRSRSAIEAIGTPFVTSVTSDFNTRANNAAATVQHPNGTVTTLNFFTALSEGRAVVAAVEVDVSAVSAAFGVHVRDLDDTIDRFLPPFFAIWGFASFEGLAALGAAWIHQRAYLPMALVWLGLLTTAALWLTHAGAIAGGLYVVDGCRDVSAAAAASFTALPAVVGCGNLTTLQYANAYGNMRRDMSRDFCEGLMPHCYDAGRDVDANIAAEAVIDCSALPSDCTTWSLVTIASATLALRADITTNATSTVAPLNRCGLGVTCSIDACIAAGGCDTAGTAFAVSRFLVGRRTAVGNAVAVDTSYGVRLATCADIVALAAIALQPTCGNFDREVVVLRILTATASLAGIGMVIATAWGAKRFFPTEQADDTDEKLKLLFPTADSKYSVDIERLRNETSLIVA